MESDERMYPLYSQCGLNCGLCPNYYQNTAGKFKCTGCGGKDFSSVHPTCSLLTCSAKKNKIDFCYQCSDFPYEKYSWMKEPAVFDSFITYQNVEANIEKIKTIGFESYYEELMKRMAILHFLLYDYNSGRQKTLFCLATNLLSYEALEGAIKSIKEQVNDNDSLKDKSRKATDVLNEVAKKYGIQLKSHKKQK